MKKTAEESGVLNEDAENFVKLLEKEAEKQIGFYTLK